MIHSKCFKRKSLVLDTPYNKRQWNAYERAFKKYEGVIPNKVWKKIALMGIKKGGLR